jgi:hypothetical protein
MIWNRCGSCKSPFISIGFWYEDKKHISMSLSAKQMNNQQKKISIEEKLDVICQLEKGEQIVDICCTVSFA